MTYSSALTSPLLELDGVAVFREPPPVYVDWLMATGAFFEGTAWGSVLCRGLHAQRFYIWDARHSCGQALTCFHKGPVRMGYLGFPICAPVNATAVPYNLDRMVAAIRILPTRPHLLRVPLSSFSNCTLSSAENAKTTIESCIEDLQTWRSDATSVRRRDLNFAKKRCGAMTATSRASGASMYDLYTSAVTRHQGNRRYTSAYFDALADIAHAGTLRIVGLNDDKGLAGMAILARHGDTDYYLHGGTRPDALRLGVADLLMTQAITDAHERSALHFNFLLSPQKQTGLIRFKEKWGGVSQPAQTIDIPINVVGRLLTRLLG